jgi:hypothetical protein
LQLRPDRQPDIPINCYCRFDHRLFPNLCCRNPPLLFGLSLIGIVLFFAASVMGTWLLIAILKRVDLINPNLFEALRPSERLAPKDVSRVESYHEERLQFIEKPA